MTIMVGKTGKIALGAVLGGAALFGSIAAISASQSQPSLDPVVPSVVVSERTGSDTESGKTTAKDNAKSQPATVRTVEETEESTIPYETTYVDDVSLAQGTTQTITAGQAGVSTKYYKVKYEGDTEVDRELVRTETTSEPIAEVIARGTYVAPTTSTSAPAAASAPASNSGSSVSQSTPTTTSSSTPTSSGSATASSSTSSATSSSSAPATPSNNTPALTTTAPAASACENGSYVNSAGNTVCRPSASNTGGATAICRDGTYSYSQSSRGTCSHHGGVREWL